MADILGFIHEVTTEAEAFEKHPAKNLSLEERLLYLQGLALVMNADDNVHAEEMEYLRILIKSLEMNESILDELVEFATHPDKEMAQAFFRTFRRSTLAQLFLFDAWMMTYRDHVVHEKEKAVVNAIGDKLEVLKGTQQDIYDLFCHIKNRNWRDSALYFSVDLLNPAHFKHLLVYHEVDFDELMESIADMQKEKTFQLLTMHKLPDPQSEETSTAQLLLQELSHDIVIPALQAEIDRGQATVKGGLLTVNREDSLIHEVEIASLGVGWNAANNSLYSETPQNIDDPRVIDYMNQVFGIRGKTEADPVIPIGEAFGCCELKLSSPLTESLPYVRIGNSIFKYFPGRYDAYGEYKLFLRKRFSENKEYLRLDYSSSDGDSRGTLVNITRSKSQWWSEFFSNGK